MSDDTRGSAWDTFRGMPIGVRVGAWIVLWPTLVALRVATRPRRGTAGRLGAATIGLLGTSLWLVGAATAVGTPLDSGVAPDAPAVAPTQERATDDPTTAGEAREGEAAGDGNGTLEVHVLDVGQADAALIRHDEVAILIDAGHWQRDDVVGLLRDRGVDRLDLVVVTHPHADHLGQFDRVLDAIEVDEVWWSGSETTTQTFVRALDALERSDATYEEPRTGDTATLGPLDIEIHNPPPGHPLDDLHDAGLVLRITYGDTRWLFTGDADRVTERRLVAQGGLDADVLMLGHHGSSTSTIPSFLDAVDPAVAVYSAGVDNVYGHPHDEVIDRVERAGIAWYGTDVHGHVLLTTDGTDIEVTTTRSGP
ncbi:MAG: MBL fold metallo-hydrolase [Nitriliruptoraceae bacterium]|nr:MBL fold metallo-hydrolase [Nitriliruptoraceae bacterium]